MAKRIIATMKISIDTKKQDSYSIELRGNEGFPAKDMAECFEKLASSIKESQAQKMGDYFKEGGRNG